MYFGLIMVTDPSRETERGEQGIHITGFPSWVTWVCPKIKIVIGYGTRLEIQYIRAKNKAILDHTPDFRIQVDEILEDLLKFKNQLRSSSDLDPTYPEIKNENIS